MSIWSLYIIKEEYWRLYEVVLLLNIYKLGTILSFHRDKQHEGFICH
jgi:hypothetical protein